MALSATVCYKKSNWLECHCYHCLLKNQFTNTLLLVDSTIAGLSRCLKVWPGPILESKGMGAVFRKRAKKC